MTRGKKTEKQEKELRKRTRLIAKATAGDKDAAWKLAEQYKITKVYSQEEITERS